MTDTTLHLDDVTCGRCHHAALAHYRNPSCRLCGCTLDPLCHWCGELTSKHGADHD